MVVFDPNHPERVVHFSANVPGHFNWIQPEFEANYPAYRGTRYSLCVQEVDEFPAKGEIAKNPREQRTIEFLGEITREQFVNLVATGRLTE